MVIHPYAKIWYAYVKEQRHFFQTQIHGKVKGQGHTEFMNVCDTLTMVIHSCAEQSLTMSKDKKAKAWTQSHVINPINLTLRSKFKIVSGSWMYAPHRLMVIHSCAKYGKPMSTKKKLWAKHEPAQKDGQTDRQKEWFLYTPWTSFTGGIKMCLNLCNFIVNLSLPCYIEKCSYGFILCIKIFLLKSIPTSCFSWYSDMSIRMKPY